MELSMDNSGMEESALLHLIEFLGNTLARLHATQAKEEYGLSDIVASIKFVNRTVDAWNNSSQQQVPESSEVHIYESDFSEVSKSIDAILDEARMARGTSKLSASSKGPLSSPRDTITETPRKPKAEDHKKKLESFSQALRMRLKKTISSVDDAEYSAALKWMENKDGWFNTHAQQKCFDSTRRSTPCSEECFPEKSNAERKFLDALWSIHSIPPHSSTNAVQAENESASGDLNEMENENGPSNITGAKNQDQAMIQRMQKNVEVLQAHCKLLEERYLKGELLHLEDLPFMILNVEEKQCQHGNHEEESVSKDDCWLPEVCWKVLETQEEGNVLEHATQPVPIFDSHLQQALTIMQVMHSIQTNLFYCHLQSLLAQSFLKPLARRSMRVDDLLSSSSVYLCFRLAHCLVCKDGKALFSIARRITIS